MRARANGWTAGILAAAAAWSPAAAALPPPRTVSVVDEALIEFSMDDPKVLRDGDFVMRHARQVIERNLELPAAPVIGDAVRIVGRVRVEPIVTTDAEGRTRPNDTWNRLGSVGVDTRAPDGSVIEIELMRFVTPYGGPAVFEQDLTAFGPLLHGRRTLRLFLASYSLEPGWRVSLELTYGGSAGYRNPQLVLPVFSNAHVDGEEDRTATLTTGIDIPEGFARPRLRIVSTGHATDGVGGQEFVTSPHRLTVDGREVLRWRPWSEAGTGLREINPWSGRQTVGDREIWASDFDRSGWQPGLAVEPLMIPLPELTPGHHEIELTIRGIRPPRGEKGHHGFWVVTAVVLADKVLDQRSVRPSGPTLALARRAGFNPAG